MRDRQDRVHLPCNILGIQPWVKKRMQMWRLVQFTDTCKLVWGHLVMVPLLSLSRKDHNPHDTCESVRKLQGSCRAR